MNISTTELGSSEILTTNERQQDRIAIRVSRREPKPDQLAWMLEEEIEESGCAGNLWQQALKTDDKGHCTL